MPQRKYSDFVFANTIVEQNLAQAASINDLLPQPEHLHIAACEADKLAYESGGGGQLTQSLLYNLKRQNGEATYVELLNQARAELTLRGQTPALTAFGKAATWQNEFFLGENEFNDPNMVQLKFLPNKGWRILSGELNGLLSQQNKSEVNLTVFDEKKPLSVNLTIEKVASSETVLAAFGTASTDLASLDIAKTYRVFVSGAYPPLRIFLRGSDDFSKKQLKMDYENPTRMKFMQAFSVKTVTTEAESDYILVAEKLAKGTALRILPTQNQTMPIAADILGGYDTLWEDVKAIQRFRKALQFNNPNTKWKSLPVAINYNILEKDGTETLMNYSETANYIEITEGMRLRISIKNLIQQPIYVAAIRLSSLFGMDNTLLPNTKLETKNDTLLLQGGAMTFTAAPYTKDFHLPHDVTNHLFIISTQSIDTSLFQQKDLPPPQKASDKAITMRSQGRASEVRRNDDDWTTLVVQIGVIVA